MVEAGDLVRAKTWARFIPTSPEPAFVLVREGDLLLVLRNPLKPQTFRNITNEDNCYIILVNDFQCQVPAFWIDENTEPP